MRCRNMLLSSVLALAGTLAVAPGFAQSAQPTPSAPDTQSSASPSTSSAAPSHRARHHVRTAPRESRSERKTTEQLNEQQLAQAQSGTNAQTAQAGAVSSDAQAGMAAPSTEATGTAPAPADTNSNVSPNQNLSSTSASDTSATSAQAKVAANSSPTTPQTTQTPSPTQGSAVPVTQVQNAQQTLAQAKVENTSGKPLGTVQQISRDANGAPAKVQVELDQSLGLGVRSVWINADQLQYEPQNNAVTTNLTPDQLNSM
jgi:hypothetical protein